MTLAQLIATHLSEFIESTRGDPPQDLARERFLELVAERYGIAPTVSPSAWRAAVPIVRAVIMTLDPERYPALPPPQSFHGWTVSRDSRGYLRLARKRRGILQSVYIGKRWDEDTAYSKLAAAGYAVSDDDPQ